MTDEELEQAQKEGTWLLWNPVSVDYGPYVIRANSDVCKMFAMPSDLHIATPSDMLKYGK